LTRLKASGSVRYSKGSTGGKENGQRFGFAGNPLGFALGL
jgi:hypothetical protein